ncbi:NAD-dependent epimerase/dehydratase family protein [Halovivax gelatinilyticus]|uniref:NAD-dependent epimerase/dehydratase family protein n=1 Tax=Halovivax gelatinilyticus TaxID=2961597 RepID=UPI0020CA4AFF|nr:NAD(P)-dependent oxidoreductase [Halovivax gelatinilyticus]
METLLVTGALGGIGRWTIDDLAGSYEIVGVDLSEPTHNPYETVEYLAADLTEQGPAWEITAHVDPDVVVHLAAVPGAGHRGETETFLTNVSSTYNVLTAAGEVGADVVWTSSEATYGVTFGDEARPLAHLPIDETHPQRPLDGYGLSKVVGETIAERTSRRYGTAVTSVQPSWVQIPGAYQTRAVRETFDLDDPAPSGSLWSYVDVRDVATLIRRVIETDRTGHERFLATASDNYVDVPTADAIDAAWGRLPEECSLTGDESAFSTTAARSELGWAPEHSWRGAETADVDRPLSGEH